MCIYNWIYIQEKYYDIPNIKMSETYNDSNCIISWSTVVERNLKETEKNFILKPDEWSVG